MNKWQFAHHDKHRCKPILLDFAPLFLVAEMLILLGGGGRRGKGGTPLYQLHTVGMLAPKGMVFKSFWSEIGNKFWPFWSGIE